MLQYSLLQGLQDSATRATLGPALAKISEIGHSGEGYSCDKMFKKQIWYTFTCVT